MWHVSDHPAQEHLFGAQRAEEVALLVRVLLAAAVMILAGTYFAMTAAA